MVITSDKRIQNELVGDRRSLTLEFKGQVVEHQKALKFLWYLLGRSSIWIFFLYYNREIKAFKLENNPPGYDLNRCSSCVYDISHEPTDNPYIAWLCHMTTLGDDAYKHFNIKDSNRMILACCIYE